MQDTEIIRLFFDRSEKAVAEARAKYGGVIAGCIRNILRCSEDAEECESDTYMAAWRSIPPARPDNLRAYLLKIARNTAINRCRRLSADKRGRNVSVSFEELSECISGSEGGYKDRELGEAINGFLETLSPENRRIFLLRYWYCASVKDIALRCGIGVSSTESKLFRTRKALKKYLRERGYEV